MKILFHNKTLNYRGVTNSIVDYAYWNQEILNNESVLVYQKNYSAEGLDTGSKPEVIEEISKRFKVLSYETSEELEKIAEQYDVMYTQKAGHVDDDIVYSTRLAVHCVFQYCQPHGDAYAYISRWLANKMSILSPDEPFDYVPYVVNLPPIMPGMREAMRDALGIPRNAYVIGRHGGYATFDIESVHLSLPVLCDRNPNLWFVLANTRPLVQHPRIIYAPPFFGGHTKTMFISACDAAIHARGLGESFGLGICETLFHNKPVLACEVGFDENHIELLSSHNLIYAENEFIQKVEELMNRQNEHWSDITLPYTPQEVMAKFKKVFLDN